MYDLKTVQLANNSHQSKFNSNADVQSYAPGRIEILGNHTDYNLGTTLSAAINCGTSMVISKSKRNGVNLFAADLNKSIHFDPTNNEKISEKYNWANYVKGVFYLLQYHDIKVNNVNCTFSGSIPMGAGLSSSAALEVATAYAIISYANKSLDPLDIAKIAQKAEQDFAGCNCGLLDQFSSIFGINSGLVYSDFRTLMVKNIKIPSDIRFIMINPNIKHSLVDSPYNSRRISCEKAVVELNKILPYDIKSLRDVNWKDFRENKDKIDSELAKRAEHVIAEIHRVEQSLFLLEEQNLEDFGKLLYDSHETSRLAFENSCPELDIVVNAAIESDALGARLSGGGWGGSVVVLARENETDVISKKIIKKCIEKGLNPTAEIIIPSDGAQIITL